LAEVAQVEAQVQAEKAAELAALELERPVIHEVEETAPAQTLEERARALFKDLPPAPPETEDSTEVAVQEEPVNGAAADAAAHRPAAPAPVPTRAHPTPGATAKRTSGSRSQAGVQQQCAGRTPAARWTLTSGWYAGSSR
jgi:hypothetical protein